MFCCTYRLPGACHREHGWYQTLLDPDQVQEKCMHYLPESKRKKIPKLDVKFLMCVHLAHDSLNSSELRPGQARKPSHHIQREQMGFR